MNDTAFYILLTVALLIAANIVFSIVAKRRHPPIGHFIEVDGVRLHMIERGDKAAPALVMLHGNGELIEKALAQMDVTEAVMLGHSWGTLVALALTQRPSSAAHGLVLVSGYYF